MVVIAVIPVTQEAEIRALWGLRAVPGKSKTLKN
jgi:hypothetical protein